MGIKNMQGTSAHLEYIGPKGRKRRSCCAYYEKGICKYSRIQTYLSKCVGRVFCGYFTEDTTALEQEKEYKESLLKQHCKETSLKQSYKECTNHQLYGKIFRVIELGTGKIFEFKFVKSPQVRSDIIKEYSFNSKEAKKFLDKKSSDLIKFSKKKKYRILGIREDSLRG